MRPSTRLLPAAFCVLLTSCVPLPPGMVPSTGQSPTSSAPGSAPGYPDVEPGGTSQSTTHFVLRGYNDSDLRTVSGAAEDIFSRIGTDTGLYSYLAGQTYTILVYKDQNEYTTKTKEPNGSRVTSSGSTIYTYAGPDLDPPLAHQIMHVIFNAYMADKAVTFPWVNEGLAMYEEVQRMTDYEKLTYQTTQSNKLRRERMPFSQMTFYQGKSEENRKDETWYLQSESVIAYLLKQGTSLSFAAFLNDLRSGTDLDLALTDSYGGRYRNKAELESLWQASL